ncbi:hypothetical protein LUZ62_056283 [Rhynchospora pubera]|uniref:WRKY domain-containing protein n=1 Tax=Rhynchospora pubera TaxID=906938 RepID=A0AAV8DXW3_9POAL|nr:hypothetical protein LUZ62_056283 [Rhynchospora pubera]
MGNSKLGTAAAISEVVRGYDIIKQLQGLLQLKSRKAQDEVQMQELAQPLFREGLQALNHALSILNSSVSKVEVKSEIVVIESASPVHSNNGSMVSYASDQRIENGRGKRRRVGENSWITNTTMPCDDGYQWRKYGDKKLTGSNFSRSYFRCTYKEEQGCQAKKVVQQTSDKLDMPLFQVTYTNKHTCNSQNTRSPSPTQQKSTFCSIKQDNSINQKSHLQECLPSRPLQLNQGSCFGDINLRQIISSTSMNEINCEWDLDSLLRDFVDFASYDCPL